MVFSRFLTGITTLISTALWLLRTEKFKEAVKQMTAEYQFAALYDLRLALSRSPQKGGLAEIPLQNRGLHFCIWRVCTDHVTAFHTRLLLQLSDNIIRIVGHSYY